MASEVSRGPGLHLPPRARSFRLSLLSTGVSSPAPRLADGGSPNPSRPSPHAPKKGEAPSGKGQPGPPGIAPQHAPIPPAAKPFKRNKGSRGRGRGVPFGQPRAGVDAAPPAAPQLWFSGAPLNPHPGPLSIRTRAPPTPALRRNGQPGSAAPSPAPVCQGAPPTPALAPGGFRSLLTVRCSAGSSRTHFLCLFLSLSLLQPLVPPRPIPSGSFQRRERILLNGVCTESTHPERAHTHTHSHPAVAPNQCPNLEGGSPSSLRL